jgi:Rod binding domain-containing protein
MVMGTAAYSEVRVTEETAPEAAKRLRKDQQLRKACQDFESYFWRIVMKEAFKSLPKGSLLNKGGPTGIYIHMALGPFCDTLAENGDLGLAHTLYESLKAADAYKVSHGTSDMEDEARSFKEVRA